MLDELKTIIEHTEKTCSSEEDSYYWLSYYGLKKIVSMNPYDHLESEQKRKDEKRHFFIENKECSCDRGGLHPMIAKRENIFQ